ncbi:hypothetical protein LQG66_34860 [Bradyrhizobium ontarionense]|uniref:Uncharacterized protein n=1 Tax=Bradyrhizobium ontarionense TaxID=2898149 RepID=A0ABY3RAS9_9BRAD|nr:hypothetical protein [Bradyrhizobium sp. A19]UFZ04311.1 hypothetical protein LQG66_34860 [Bradyrhizobium sp. A19]
MVTALLHTTRRFELSSGQIAQVVKAAQQPAAAEPAPFAMSGAKELLSGKPPCSSSRQETGNVTGVGDALNARRHKVRRCKRQTVQQRMGIGSEKLRTAETESLHGSILILSNAQNT